MDTTLPGSAAPVQMTVHYDQVSDAIETLVFGGLRWNLEQIEDERSVTGDVGKSAGGVWAHYEAQAKAP